MKIHSVIIDDFLYDAEDFRKYAVKRSYSGVTNPQDGVVYPDVTIDIPEEIKLEITEKLSLICGTLTQDYAVKVHPKVMFMRLSKKGVHVPNQAHTDKNIADYTLLLYLNVDEECQGGTDILEHIEGMKIHPQNEEEKVIWEKDANIPEQWVKVGFCPMKFNRAFLLRSDLFHRAQPVGGFGKTNEDGRLVLTVFFNLV